MDPVELIEDNWLLRAFEMGDDGLSRWSSIRVVR
jgi:hypothetical protein